MKCDLKLGVNVDASDLNKVEAQLTRIVDLLDRINREKFHFLMVKGRCALLFPRLLLNKIRCR